ncbi:unnamed protein product [Brassicogethes aeneus]|uniref:Facilitated trehalose transporter Tret1-like n=1 Tax=Brassicogethes aeneus TaxID=1431903 RepID=A0A9P0B076_BRAAE|nr:unnamed protein product [Brassicogethes aeneus]
MEGLNLKTLLVVSSVGLLATAGDTMMTWVSPMYVKLYSNDTNINPLGAPISREQDTWIGSIINIGSMVGPFPFGFISGRFGRKIALLSIAVPYFISYVILAFARDVNLYYFARLFAGISIGGGYTLLPTYVTEVTEDSTRGLMTSLLNVFWTFGNLIPYAVGPYLSHLWFNLILAVLPALFFVMFLIIAPESPYYLLGKNREDEALKSLMTLRSGDEKSVSTEFDHIKYQVENEQHGSITDIIKTPALRKAITLAMLIVFFQQVSGVKALMFYLQFIFKASGGDIPPEISAIIFGSVLFLSSIVVPTVADRFGRKTLLTISSVGTGFSLACVGAFFYVLEHNTDVSSISWLPMLSLISFVIFFNLGHGSIAWTVTAELFPSHIRPVSASIVSSTCWLTGFIITKTFSDLRDNLGDYGTFWLFSSSCVVSALFMIIILPETKGKSFKEIQLLLENKHKK